MKVPFIDNPLQNREKQRKELDLLASFNRDHLAQRGVDSELESRIASYELAFIVNPYCQYWEKYYWRNYDIFQNEIDINDLINQAFVFWFQIWYQLPLGNNAKCKY